MAIFSVDGAFYAVNNICPHMGGPFGAGEVHGAEVSCPYHGMRFDLKTGHSTDVFGHSLQTYRVKVQDGEVCIEVWWGKDEK